MTDNQTNATIAEIEAWATQIENTGNYFPRLEDRARAVLTTPMPEAARARLEAAIDRIARMRSAKRH